MRWFKHFSDTHNSPQMKEAVNTFGKIAVAWYWLIIEAVALQMTSEHPTPEGYFTTQYLASLLGIKTKNVEKVLISMGKTFDWEISFECVKNVPKMPHFQNQEFWFSKRVISVFKIKIPMLLILKDKYFSKFPLDEKKVPTFEKKCSHSGFSKEKENPYGLLNILTKEKENYFIKEKEKLSQKEKENRPADAGLSPPLASEAAMAVEKSKKHFYPPPFETFWTLYPRKVGKASALRAWENARKRFSFSHSDLLSLCQTALDWQKISPDWTKDNGQFIPHPTTYLNQARWDDTPPQNILISHENSKKAEEIFQKWKKGDPNDSPKP